jgi:hypothetical protein
MSSIVYNKELEVASCYCGRFDLREVVYPEELTFEGECLSCIELSKCEDLNDDMNREGEVKEEIKEFSSNKLYMFDIIKNYPKTFWKQMGYDSFEKMIVGEYGDESEQAKRYGFGVFKPSLDC